MNKLERPNPPGMPDYPTGYGDNYPDYPEASPLNILKYLDILLDGWPLMVGTLLGFLILAVSYIFITPRQYTATAVVQVDEQDQSHLELNNQSWQDAQGSPEKLNTVVENFQSLPLRVWVISEAGLVPNLDSFIGSPPNSNRSVASPVASAMAGMTSGVTITNATMLKALNLAGGMEKKMKAKLRRNTRLIDLSVTYDDPAQSARLANLMVAGYLEQAFKIRSQTDRSQSELFQSASQRLADKLKASEQALQNYRELEGTVELSTADSRSDSQLQDIASYKHQLSDMKAQVIQFKAAYEGALAMGTNCDGLLAYSQISSDPQVQLLQTAIAQKQADLLQLKQLYREKNPKYVVAVNTLSDLKQQLQEVVLAIRSRIQESLRLPYLKAQAQVTGLESELARAEVKSLELSRKSIQFNLLAREVASDQALFNMALEKLKVTAANSEVAPVNISLVSAAVPPTIPSTPKVRLSLMAAVVLGLGFGAFLVLLRASLKNNLGTVEEAELFLPVPILCFLPDLKLMAGDQRQKLLFTNTNLAPAATELFRSIIASLTIQARNTADRSFLFTSTVPKEGKTFMSATFAAGLARQGLRTVVLDFDLHKPTLDDYFRSGETASATGLADVLLGKCQLIEVIRPHAALSNLWWVPAGAPLANISEFLAGDRLEKILAELLAKYDRVVIDTAPLGPVKDALYLANRVNAIILVVNSTETNRNQVKQSIQLFQKIQAPLLGVALNFVPRRKMRSDYYDHYYQTTS